MELTPDGENNTTKFIENLNTLRFQIGLQSFTDIDEPIIFNVDIHHNFCQRQVKLVL